jgi:LuxR family maltose regulon positive regulatory protein
MAHDGELERAVELLAVTAPHRFIDKHENDEARLRADLEAALPPDVFAAAWKRGAKRTPEEVIAELSGQAQVEPAQPLVDLLSERELEVLCLLAAGLSNQEIAQQLLLSVGTVKVRTHSIYGKLGVDSRTKAVARARELGLL